MFGKKKDRGLKRQNKSKAKQTVNDQVVEQPSPAITEEVITEEDLAEETVKEESVTIEQQKVEEPIKPAIMVEPVNVRIKVGHEQNRTFSETIMSIISIAENIQKYSIKVEEPEQSIGQDTSINDLTEQVIEVHNIEVPNTEVSEIEVFQSEVEDCIISDEASGFEAIKIDINYSDLKDVEEQYNGIIIDDDSVYDLNGTLIMNGIRLSDDSIKDKAFINGDNMYFLPLSEYQQVKTIIDKFGVTGVPCKPMFVAGRKGACCFMYDVSNQPAVACDVLKLLTKVLVETCSIINNIKLIESELQDNTVKVTIEFDTKKISGRLNTFLSSIEKIFNMIKNKE